MSVEPDKRPTAKALRNTIKLMCTTVVKEPKTEIVTAVVAAVNVKRRLKVNFDTFRTAADDKLMCSTVVKEPKTDMVTAVVAAVNDAKSRLKVNQPKSEVVAEVAAAVATAMGGGKPQDIHTTTVPHDNINTAAVARAVHVALNKLPANHSKADVVAVVARAVKTTILSLKAQGSQTIVAPRDDINLVVQPPSKLLQWNHGETKNLKHPKNSRTVHLTGHIFSS